MSKTVLKYLAVALALGLFPTVAAADDASTPPYQGPLPAGGAMTNTAAAYWYDTNQALEIGGGLLLIGGAIALLSHKNGSSPATTTTH